MFDGSARSRLTSFSSVRDDSRNQAIGREGGIAGGFRSVGATSQASGACTGQIGAVLRGQAYAVASPSHECTSGCLCLLRYERSRTRAEPPSLRQLLRADAKAIVTGPVRTPSARDLPSGARISSQPRGFLWSVRQPAGQPPRFGTCFRHSRAATSRSRSRLAAMKRPRRRPSLSFFSRACQISALVPIRSRISATSREIAALPSRNSLPV